MLSKNDYLKISNSQWGRYRAKGKSFVYNQLVGVPMSSSRTINGVELTNNQDGSITLNGTSTAVCDISITSHNFIMNHKYLSIKDKPDDRYYVRIANSVNISTTGDYDIKTCTGNETITLRMIIYQGKTFNNDKYRFRLFDLTDLENYYDVTINTLEDFYTLLECGKQVKNGAHLPYSAGNTIYNAVSPFNFYKDNELVATYSNPLTLRQGDTFTNTNGKNNVVMGSYTFTGNETMSYDSNGKRFVFGTQSIPNFKVPVDAETPVNAIIDGFKAVKRNNADTLDNVFYVITVNGNMCFRKTSITDLATFKQFITGKTIIYELATPQTNILPSQMIPSGVTSITDANGVELEFDVLGISVAYNQLIPDAHITKTINITSSPSANQLDPYILIKDPSLVGQRVYAKITTSNPKLRVGWYKTLNTGYDFATGTAITSNSAIPTATEGVYEITQDMVHAGTNYLQLYFFKGAGLEVGNHTITIQLISLSQLGMQNIINLPIFKATQLGKLTNRINFEFTGTTNKIYSK